MFNFVILPGGNQSSDDILESTLSTDITYKYGNPYLGVRYPQITLCHPNIYLKHPMFKECRNEALEFITVISSCMKSSNTLEIADLIQNLHPEIGNIVKMVQGMLACGLCTKKSGHGYFLMI